MFQKITAAEVSKIKGRPDVTYYVIGADGAAQHYRWDGTQMVATLTQTERAAVGAQVSGPVFAPQNENVLAGLSAGVNDDTAAVAATIAKAVAAGNGTVDLGNGTYRCTAPIGTLITKPIHLIGRGAVLVIDPGMTGDLLSFSNTWYGSDTTQLAGGGTGVGTALDAVAWSNRASKKNGVHLSGFGVMGDRRTTQIQNGIIFYDRNDNAVLRDIQVDFVKGIGLCLAGIPSNPVVNAASMMRESIGDNIHVRWCGDMPSGRPAVVFNSTDKGAASSDDACNYNEIRAMKIMFPHGVGFQSNCHNLNSNQFSNNNVSVIVDTPQETSGASVTGSTTSIAAGVLTIVPGGTLTGSFGVGQFLNNASIPLGTYISAQLTGTPGGVGTYQLANRTTDISTLAVSSGGNMGTLRSNIPFVQIGGGHVGDEWDIKLNGSNTLGTGTVGIEFNHNVLHASTAKTQASRLNLFNGSIDSALMFTSINSLDVTWRVRNAVTSVTALNITQSVTVNLMEIGGANDIAIGGVVTNLHVQPGQQRVVSALPQANKYPNCVLFLKSGNTFTKNVSDGSAWYTA